MPLKPCRKCKVLVSAEAKTCPQCGVKRPTDKNPLISWKYAAAVTTVLLVMGSLFSSIEKKGTQLEEQTKKDSPAPTSTSIKPTAGQDLPSLTSSQGSDKHITAQDLAACTILAGKTYQVPPAVLVGIMHIENGSIGQETTPDSNGNYTMGPMQISSEVLFQLAQKWEIDIDAAHKRVRDDGCVNMRVAAWILRQKIDDAGNLYGGIAAYHLQSGAPDPSYASKVVKVMNEKGLIKGNENLPNTNSAHETAARIDHKLKPNQPVCLHEQTAKDLHSYKPSVVDAAAFSGDCGMTGNTRILFDILEQDSSIFSGTAYYGVAHMAHGDVRGWVTPEEFDLEQKKTVSTSLTYRLTNEGVLADGVPYCLTDDFLATFSRATPQSELFPHELSIKSNTTIKQLLLSGNCTINQWYEVPITILASDKGKRHPCGGSHTCEGSGARIFVRVHMPDGKAKEGWVSSNTVKVQAISTPQVATVSKGMYYCPSLLLAMQYPMVPPQSMQERKEKEKLRELGCSEIKKDSTSTIFITETDGSELYAHLSFKNPDGTTGNFWTFNVWH